MKLPRDKKRSQQHTKTQDIHLHLWQPSLILMLVEQCVRIHEITQTSYRPADSCDWQVPSSVLLRVCGDYNTATNTSHANQCNTQWTQATPITAIQSTLTAYIHTHHMTTLLITVTELVQSISDTTYVDREVFMKRKQLQSQQPVWHLIADDHFFNCNNDDPLS